MHDLHRRNVAVPELPILAADDHQRRSANVAEPGALIGFAGPRVIEQTIRQKLPEGFQRSEFLLEKGFLDAVVERRDLKGYLIRALEFLKTPAVA